MRLTRLSLLCVLTVSFTVMACGGGDDGGDAPVDAMPDAPAALTGLGKPCKRSLQGVDCPGNARGCLTFGGAEMGICTERCVINGTMMTNAQAQVASVTPDPRAPAQSGICTAIFMGTVGAAGCLNLVGGFLPADNPLQPNKQYTNVDLVCGIACGAGNTCPGGLTCTNAQCGP